MNGLGSFRGTKVLVVGLAATGLEVANCMARAGALVTVSEARQRELLDVDISDLAAGVRTEFGGHKEATFLNADLIVPSPGVPRDLSNLVAAGRHGIKILSEVELAAGLISKPILAVTGTNGKSTTVSLLGAMLKEGGLRAPVVGNIGTPLVTMAGRDEEYDCLPTEISSFQLEWINEFRPRAASILNVTSDHLDRYRDFDDYLETKLRITANMGAGESLIINYDDPVLRGLHGSLETRVIFFSKGGIHEGVYLSKNSIMADIKGSGRPEAVLDINELKLEGVHNVENVMAAAAMALDFGVPVSSVRRAALAFENLPHRNEFVAEIKGVRYYDDSKATNVGALKKSLESFPGPVILIAGGREKGGAYEPLAGEISQKVKLLILIGEARERMRSELGGLTETVEVHTMEEAVLRAFEGAVEGDIVLLSPACSSFDMFTSYHQRGQVYQEAVRSLLCRAI